jgi:hypothetical protein
VTLIAAFQCDRAVVICADSQETVGDYRVNVDKIKPTDAGHYQLVIGGAGESGPLIDRFTLDLIRAAGQWPENLTPTEIENRLGALLQVFHLTHVVASSYQSSAFAFIVCVKGKSNEEIGLWELRDTVALPVTRYSLIGWEESLYHHELKWLYRDRPWIGQAVQLGLRLFTMAKATSNYIGGPTQVIVVRDNGIHVETAADVALLESRIAEFNDALAGLVLACPDVSISNAGFRELLTVFEDRVIGLREHYTRRSAIASLVEAVTNPESQGQSDPALPFDSKIAVPRQPDIVAEGSSHHARSREHAPNWTTDATEQERESD